MVVFSQKYLILKQKKAEYDLNYRIKNKDKISKIKQEYRELNREKLNSYIKEYEIKNKEKISENKKKYYKENKDNILKQASIYRSENPKIKTGLKSTGNYNITLAERYKEKWLNENINLYLLKIIDINNKVFYKYGLAKNVKNRLYYIPYEVEIVEILTLNKYDAVYKEQALLKSVIKYTPCKKFGGYTECFTKI